MKIDDDELIVNELDNESLTEEVTTPGRRLSEIEWQAIVELWEQGDIRKKELANRFGVSAQTITKGLKDRGAIYGVRSAALIKSYTDAQEDAKLLMLRAKETKDEHYKFSTMLAKLAVSKVMKAEKKEISYDHAEQNLRVILSAMKVTGEARKERFAVLGLDREDLIVDELPELTITEMDEEDVFEVRNAKNQTEVVVEEVRDERTTEN